MEEEDILTKRGKRIVWTTIKIALTITAINILIATGWILREITLKR